MKKDLIITTAIAGALAAGLAGCGRRDNGWTADRDTAICVDRVGRRVPDANCGGGGVPFAGGSGGNPFLWYYLGRASAVPYYGEPAAGGRYTPAGGHAYSRAPAATAVTRAAAISRGGFGQSGHGFAGAGE